MSGVLGKDHHFPDTEAYYKAPDPDSGMVILREKLPPVWREKARGEHKC